MQNSFVHATLLVNVQLKLAKCEQLQDTKTKFINNYNITGHAVCNFKVL